MIKTGLNRQNKTVRVLDRKTNELIVMETRAPMPFRALPRPVLDRIVGNAQKGVIGLETSKKFLVRYQDLVDLTVTATRCWKCGVPITAYQPALRRVEWGRGASNAEIVQVRINGAETVLGAVLPYQHYREGLFAYRTHDHRLANFTYLHCADCAIEDADGECLLACLLGCPDWKRDLMKPYQVLQSDDAWAQWMFHWSGIELVGRVGPSVGPADLMKRA